MVKQGAQQTREMRVVLGEGASACCTQPRIIIIIIIIITIIILLKLSLLVFCGLPSPPSCPCCLPETAALCLGFRVGV